MFMNDGRAVLVVFSGLPGVGKTTVARALAARLGAVYLRVDTVEQAMRAAGLAGVGAAGYGVAQAVGEDNLRLGSSVVVDCVNPVRESREGLRLVAERVGVRLADVHLVCLDAVEHRRRVEGRVADIAGHVLPTWESVTRSEFEPWDDGVLVLNTAALPVAACVERCAVYLESEFLPERREEDEVWLNSPPVGREII